MKKYTVPIATLWISLFLVFGLSFFYSFVQTPTASIVAGSHVQLKTEDFIDNIQREAELGAERMYTSIIEAETAVKVAGSLLAEVFRNKGYVGKWNEIALVQSNGLAYTEGSDMQFIFQSDNDKAKDLISKARLINPVVREQAKNIQTLRHIELMLYDNVFGIYPPVSTVELLDAWNGHRNNVHRLSNVPLAENRSTTNVEQKVLLEGLWLSPITDFGEDTELPFVILVQSEGKDIAWLHADVDAKSLSTHLNEYPEQLYKGAFAFVKDEQGRIILIDSSKRQILGLSQDAPALADSNDYAVSQLSKAEGKPFATQLASGNYLVVPAPIGHTPWTYVMMIPWESLPLNDQKGLFSFN